jgi:hypothetical protein
MPAEFQCVFSPSITKLLIICVVRIWPNLAVVHVFIILVVLQCQSVHVSLHPFSQNEPVVMKFDAQNPD